VHKHRNATERFIYTIVAIPKTYKYMKKQDSDENLGVVGGL
jgi:hypothetical protein